MRLYPRLALNGIRNNGKLYYPFIGTCVGIIAIFYIVAALSVDPAIRPIKGGATLQSLLGVATIVIGIFAALFLFFTNSFVVKRRTKEFGLYNVLGMNKRNIAKIMCWETLVTYLFSLVSGTLIGILLSKFAEVGVAKIVGDTVGLEFFVPFFAIKWTVIVFLAIFALMFINSLRFVTFSNPTQMVKSEQLGEKPPKANFVIGFIGFAILIGAYFLANYNLKNNPIGAISNFLIAIVMVVIATYLIFIAGTVMICKILSKNKNYYYNKKHFVSLSSMIFRMKRSGAGLATICVLITMVLVMMSSATSLYAGQTYVIDLEYPEDYVLEYYLSSPSNISTVDPDGDREDVIKDDSETYLSIMNQIILEAGKSGNISDYISFAYMEEYGTIVNGTLDTASYVEFADGYFMVAVVSLDSYNQMMGTDIVLNDNEVLLYENGNSIGIDDIKTLDQFSDIVVVGEVEDNVVTDYVNAYVMMDSTFVLFVNDVDLYRTADTSIRIHSFFNGDFSDEWFASLVSELTYEVNDYHADCYDIPVNSSNCDDPEYADTSAWHDWNLGNCWGSSKAEFEDEVHGIYGGLMFIGIVLTIVFLGATVLLMYYRQVVEGYEDQARFKILRNVGMEKKDISASINSQILIVFLAPILLAGMHTAFALPFVAEFLKLQGMLNVALMMKVALITLVAFAAVYFVIYKLTSKAYYKIVNS